MATLPYVILTSDIDWDPTILDNIMDHESSELYPNHDESQEYGNHNFDDCGNYNKRVLNQCESLYKYVSRSQDLEDVIHNVIDYKYNITTTTINDIDYEALCPHFGFVPIDLIKRTFKVTTQYAHAVTLHNARRKHYTSRFPAFSVVR
jgi:hypothetical protein